MATNTGPNDSTYTIPEVALGDNFNVWKDITNTSVYKLNKIRVYEGVSTDSIAYTGTTGGTFSLALNPTISDGLTFTGAIVFGAGVTFNGQVTFNASTFTVNANAVTIDDYNIVLGDTAAASDPNIEAAGGGGLLLNRGGGLTAEWLWQRTEVHGITGVWRANTSIGFSGSTSGIYPAGGGVLPVHGSGIRIDGGTTTDHGLVVQFSGSGQTTERNIDFARYSAAGSTVFAEVLNGTTYGAYPFMNIRNGANRKRITQTGHGLSFGTPVYVDASGAYIPAASTGVDVAEVVGVVSNRIDANTFELTFSGEIYGNFSNALLTGASTLGSGSVYYLCNSAGKLSPSASSAPGTVHKAVMIATGLNSAVVVPFTGGLLAEDVIIASATSTELEVIQFNKFRVGDAVRYLPGTDVGLSYDYPAGIAGGFTGATYPNGIYVKAQADTEAAAEVLGVVTQVLPMSAIGGTLPGINYKFSIITDGFFQNIGGVCATNGGVVGNMVGGVQYFLAANCAGTSRAYESDVPSLADAPPTTIGHVRKPLLSSTSTVSGHIISYRGDVNNAGQSSFTGYTGASAEYTDLPVGSMIMGVTGSTLSPNRGVTVYYHNTGGLSGEYVLYLGASTVGVTLNGIWKTRGLALDRGSSGVTAYHLCQRIQ